MTGTARGKEEEDVIRSEGSDVSRCRSIPIVSSITILK